MADRGTTLFSPMARLTAEQIQKSVGRDVTVIEHSQCHNSTYVSAARLTVGWAFGGQSRPLATEAWTMNIQGRLAVRQHLACVAILLLSGGCPPVMMTVEQAQRVGEYEARVRSKFLEVYQARYEGRWEDVVRLAPKILPPAGDSFDWSHSQTTNEAEAMLAEAYLMLGRFEDALEAIERLSRRFADRDAWARHYSLGGYASYAVLACSALRDREGSRAWLRKYEKFSARIEKIEAIRQKPNMKHRAGSLRDIWSSPASTWSNMASVYCAAGEWDRAKKYASRAIGAIDRIAYARRTAQSQRSDSEEGQVGDGIRDQGKKERQPKPETEGDAEEDESGIMHIEEHVAMTVHQWRRAMLLLGRAEYHLGNYTAAERALTEAVSLSEVGDLILFELPDYARWAATFHLARAAEALGKSAEALAAYRACLGFVRKRRQTVRSDRHRLAIARVYQEPFEYAVDLLMRLGHHAEGLAVAEQAKSRALVDLLAGKEVGKAGETVKATAEWDRAREHDHAVRLVRSVSASKIHRATRSVTTRHDRLRRLDKELCSFVTGESVKPEEIRASIGQDVALVEYFQSDKATYVWTVSRSKVWGTIIQVGRSQMADKIREYRNTLTELLSARRGPAGVVSVRNAVAELTTSEERLARQLHQLLIEPVQREIHAKLVYFVPHGSLHYLPFHALHDGRQRLIEKWAIAYTPSATVLNWAQQRRARSSRKALVLCDPDVGDPRYRLQFAQSEADAIAALWQNVERRSGREAAESLLVSRGKEFDIIHLACHAEFRPDAPLQSRLLLAGDSSNDGNLTAEELYRLHLNAWLVVLSACETGLGELTRGDDVVGLTRGLLYAGTPTVVDSLWRVEDLATSFLMGEFYRNLKTVPKAEALRRAQLSTMRQYPGPVFWAAFRVVGAAQ